MAWDQVAERAYDVALVVLAAERRALVTPDLRAHSCNRANNDKTTMSATQNQRAQRAWIQDKTRQGSERVSVPICRSPTSVIPSLSFAFHSLAGAFLSCGIDGTPAAGPCLALAGTGGLGMAMPTSWRERRGSGDLAYIVRPLRNKQTRALSEKIRQQAKKKRQNDQQAGKRFKQEKIKQQAQKKRQRVNRSRKLLVA